MRKPRDYDSELKALADKARLLKERRIHQLGELVVATGADTIAADALAGALLAAVDGDTTTKEGWRRRGAAFFQRTARRDAQRADRNGDGGGAATRDGGAASL